VASGWPVVRPRPDSSNNLYLITGNGDYDGTNDFGDSVLKLSSTLNAIGFIHAFDSGSIERG